MARNERRGTFARIIEIPAEGLVHFVFALLVMVFAVPMFGDANAGYLRQTESCAVVVVFDGDTVQMSCPGRGSFKARLTGYDAPEIFTPNCLREWRDGVDAAFDLRALLWREKVTFVLQGTDEFGQRLVTGFVAGTSLAARMIGAGDARNDDGGVPQSWCWGDV